MLFPDGYYETSSESVAYAYGDHNLIRGIGSSLIVFIFFELIIAIYFIIKHKEPLHYSKCKYLQESLVEFFLVKITFSVVCSLLSLTNNEILSSIEYMICQLTAMLILLSLIAYFILFVRKYMPYELYKLNNIFRAICIAVMPVNTYGGMIPLFILELIFVIADGKLYR